MAGEEQKDQDEMLKLQQRVAQLEGQLADSIRQYNKEAGDLQNALVRLRAQLEQGEAQRHGLEYQLTLAQKKAREQMDLNEEKEREWNVMRESLQDRVSKLTQQCQDWRSTLDTVQEARARERAEHQQQLATKESELLQKATLYRKLELEHQHMNLENTSLTEALSSLKAKLSNVTEELSRKGEAVVTLTRELEGSRDVGDGLKLRLKAADERTKSLETKIESLQFELHTATLSAEAQALQTRELEAVLTDERSSHEKVVQSLQETRAMVNTLQSSLKREENKTALISDQLRSCEDECQSLRQQKRDKQTMISELSCQLQLHKNNLTTLKEELTLAKQRQSSIEESHTASLKDMDSRLNAFRAKYLPQIGQTTASPSTDVSQLPDKLQQLLHDIQSHTTNLGSTVNQLTSDLQTERQTVEQMTKECTTYREVVTARTAAMAEAEQRLSADSELISGLRAELSLCQTASSSLQSQLEQLKRREQQTHSEYTSTLNELASLKKTISDKMTSHCNYLHTLLTSINSSKTKQGSLGEGSSDSELINWDIDGGNKWESLTGPVTTAVMALMEALKRTKREAKHLKATNTSLVSTLQSTDTMYKKSTEKLTSDLESQERQWTQRVGELKSQYNTKLVESETKCFQLEQKIAELRREIDSTLDERGHYKTLLAQNECRVEELDQSLKEKVQNISALKQQLKEILNREKEISDTNHQLQDQLSQLQEVHRGYKNDRACLLACTCLLVGSLFPALVCIQELANQRTVLLRQLASSEKLRKQVFGLVRSIQNDIGEPQSQSPLESSQCSLIISSKSPPPLLRFRRVSIAVLALNRLKKLRKGTTSLFSINIAMASINPQLHFAVHVGQRLNKHLKQVQHSQKHGHSATDIAGWLRSERVLSDVRDCFSDLQSTLDSITLKQSSSRTHSPNQQTSKQKLNDQRIIVNPTRDCFIQLMRKMSPCFTRDNDSVLMGESLCCRLRLGLEKALQRVSAHHSYCSSAELCESLHTQLTSLVGRLHEGEIKRHSQYLQLEQHKTEIQRLSNACHDALGLESQVEKLREDLVGMVSHERYISVCGDLEAALKREQELKMSLSQHGVAIRQLQTKLHQQGQSTQTKSAALCVLEKELDKLRVNLEHKEEQLETTREHLELANRERLQQAQQLGELQTTLITCRRQISLAHAAVIAESDN